MRKKYLISERQYKKIISENEFWSSLWNSTKEVAKPLVGAAKEKGIEFAKDVFFEQKNIMDNVIPKMAKNFYPKDGVKEDGFRHLLSAAYFTTKVGSRWTLLGGYMVEILGSIKQMLKLEGFTSGWSMDVKNNDIGITIGKENKRSNLTDLAEIIKPIIDSGEFYTNNGILYKNDPNPKK